MSDLYRTRVGCITPYIRLRPYSADVEGLCLYACFVQDAEGNFVNRHLRTSLVSEIVEADDGGVEVITAYSICVFEPATPLEPEFREAKNILELWLGKGDHRFGKGVHYDTEAVAATDKTIEKQENKIPTNAQWHVLRRCVFIGQKSVKKAKTIVIASKHRRSDFDPKNEMTLCTQ